MPMGPLEDWRGVDVGQIRERLVLTPAERVERLVAEVRVWHEILASVAKR